MPPSHQRPAFARLLSRISSVEADLPYNWNWQREWAEAAEFLEENPIVLIDVGARGPAPRELDSLKGHVRRVGFEADPDECRRLNAQPLGRFFPTLLARSPGAQTLHLYREPGYSSLLTLSERYQRLWSGHMPIVKDIEVEATTLDIFLTEHPDISPDMLKLDTQGSELAILESSEATLERVGLVEVEVEFSHIYENQPLYGDVASFLHGHGFELLYLNRAFMSRRQVYQGPSRGQVVFADALFGKAEDQLGSFADAQLVKYIILLCQYGHLDIAWQLLQQSPQLHGLVPRLHSAFGRQPSSHVRAIIMQLDKLLALAMHLRRHNQRSTDSDRSWPIR